MRKIIDFLKKWWLIIFLSLVVSLLISIIVRSKSTSTEKTPAITPVPPSPTPELLEPAPTWNNITPGTTDKNNLTKTLGQPIRQENENDYLVLEFKSKSKVRNHKIFLKNDIVQFIRTQVTRKDNRNFSEFNDKYGEPDQVYFDENASAGFQIGAYPSRGIAVNYSPNDGTILEIWYFIPTSTNQFTKDFGKNINPKEERFIPY